MEIIDTLPKTSLMNDAMLQIQRLHNIWNDARSKRESGKLLECRWILDSAEIELSDDIEKIDESITDGKQTISKKLGEINDKLKKKDNLKRENEVNFYNILLDKEKLLRNVQNRVGKGSKFKDTEEDDMD